MINKKVGHLRLNNLNGLQVINGHSNNQVEKFNIYINKLGLIVGKFERTIQVCIYNINIFKEVNTLYINTNSNIVEIEVVLHNLNINNNIKDSIIDYVNSDNNNNLIIDGLVIKKINLK